jgi:hypothetical protein
LGPAACLLTCIGRNHLVLNGTVAGLPFPVEGHIRDLAEGVD